MFARALRSTFLLPKSTSALQLPPTYLLPLRSHLSTISHSTDPSPPLPSIREIDPSKEPSKLSTIPPSHQPNHNHSLQPPTFPPAHTPSATHIPVPPSSASLPPSSLTRLRALALQPPHYAILHIHSHPYLLTSSDTLHLPFRIPNAPPGTILRLTKASVLGSRDYTYRGKPWVDAGSFVCRVRVVGVEGEELRIKEKTKRRQRRVKRVGSKMRMTVVRVVELRVGEGVGVGEGKMV